MLRSTALLSLLLLAFGASAQDRILPLDAAKFDPGYASGERCLKEAKGLVAGSVPADSGALLHALILKSPTVRGDVDCRMNEVSFAFMTLNDLPGIRKSAGLAPGAPIGFWINMQDVDVLLKGDGWKKVAIGQAQSGDLVVLREQGKVKTLGRFAEVVKKDGKTVVVWATKFSGSRPFVHGMGYPSAAAKVVIEFWHRS